MNNYDNDLFYLCSLIEYIARKTHNTKEYVVNKIGKDYETGKMVLGVLYKLCKENNKTVIVITHNSALCPMADHVMHIKNGTITSEEFNENPTPISEIEW